MRVVNNLTILLLTCIYTNCAAQSHKTDRSEMYEVVRYRSENGSSYIDLNAFEFEDKSRTFPAVYQINDIIFAPDSIGSFKLHVLEGKFRIRAGAISKKWAEINDLEVQKGDSIYIKVYLENDLEPLHD